ncbi:MAG: lamin tail domain-containing protein, partial [Planctomycetota bacterium]
MATPKRLPILAVIVWLFGTGTAWGQAGPTVVINELHTDPDVKTELVEFVELHNHGTETVDISGWSFTVGVFYTFPDRTSLPAGGYVIVAENPTHILAGRTATGLRVPESLVYGPYGGKLGNDGERVVLCDADGEIVDEVTYQLGFPWPTVGDPALDNQPGTGRSMQLVNPAFDNDLAGSWRSGNPTPGAENVGWANNIAPHIRQVKHTPNRPRSGQAVTITAKITDPDGVQNVVLTYQVVVPGAYVSLRDAAYEANWTMVDMRDDGQDGDMRGNDSIYTVRLPAAEQINRALVRYRIF